MRAGQQAELKSTRIDISNGWKADDFFPNYPGEGEVLEFDKTFVGRVPHRAFPHNLLEESSEPAYKFVPLGENKFIVYLPLHSRQPWGLHSVLVIYSFSDQGMERLYEIPFKPYSCITFFAPNKLICGINNKLDIYEFNADHQPIHISTVTFNHNKRERACKILMPVDKDRVLCQMHADLYIMNVNDRTFRLLTTVYSVKCVLPTLGIAVVHDDDGLNALDLETGEKVEFIVEGKDFPSYKFQAVGKDGYVRYLEVESSDTGWSSYDRFSDGTEKFYKYRAPQLVLFLNQSKEEYQAELVGALQVHLEPKDVASLVSEYEGRSFVGYCQVENEKRKATERVLAEAKRRLADEQMHLKAVFGYLVKRDKQVFHYADFKERLEDFVDCLIARESGVELPTLNQKFNAVSHRYNSRFFPCITFKWQGTENYKKVRANLEGISDQAVGSFLKGLKNKQGYFSREVAELIEKRYALRKHQSSGRRATLV